MAGSGCRMESAQAEGLACAWGDVDGVVGDGQRSGPGACGLRGKREGPGMPGSLGGGKPFKVSEP